MQWKVIKRYGHEQGLSCVFKQFRAPETHCSFLHGYALAFTICFEGDYLDDRNWLISFGELKMFKQWLQDMFDHKTLIAASDPDLATMMDLEKKKIVQLQIVPEVGCEIFAKLAYEWLVKNLLSLAPRQAEITDELEVRVKYVEVSEHSGNTVRYEPTARQDKYAGSTTFNEQTPPTPTVDIVYSRNMQDTPALTQGGIFLSRDESK